MVKQLRYGLLLMMILSMFATSISVNAALNDNVKHEAFEIWQVK